MEPLSTEARARLAAFRRAESPDPEIAERCLAALEQRRAELTADDRRRDPPRRRIAAPLLAGLALAAGLLLALTWAVTHSGSASLSGSAAAYHNHDEPARHVALPRAPRPSPRALMKVAPAAPGQPAAPDEPVPSDTPAPADLAAPETPVPSDTPKSAPRRRAEDVAAEVDLLRRAKLAEPAARLALLEEHARRFPTGILAAERGLLEIEARCALNEVERARDLAERFPRRFPGSPLIDRAVTLCGNRDP